jgi:thiamine biosynthesis lipoprotein
MRVATFIVALAVVPITEAEVVQRARYLMGTVCEVAVGGAGAEAEIESAFAEAKRIESMLSTWIEDSELSRVNRGAEPSAELRALLDQALEWSRRTNGAFDPRIGHLVQRGGRAARPPAPDVPSGAETTPSSETLAGSGRDARPPIWEEGAFGKGYALDRMLALTSGDAVFDFGGQIIVRGALDVTIADPTNRVKPVLAFTLENASLSTSGDSEKPGHIIDPRTERSVPSRGSVSVIADDALAADILSTALYVMGEDEGIRWADAHGIAAVFIDITRHVRLSAAARERARGLRILDRNFTLKD